ncbi:MAG: hypothetical protein ACLVCU_07190 [Gallintestinimicrobium sp.]|uniref:hypothetical protein n=1 Tax=Gallintestinimicrobium sp. TaxID=2981655 RepID=UPI003999DD6F
MSFGSDGMFYDNNEYRKTADKRSYSAVPYNPGTDIVVAIGFLLCVPIALLWMVSVKLIEWISSHLYIFFVICAIIAAVICFFLSKIKKHKKVNFILSFVGNYLSFLSFIYIILFCGVPEIILDEGSFESFLGFTLIFAFALGAVAILQFFNYYHGKALLEFICGLIFFGVVMKLLKNNISEISTLEHFAKIYKVEVSIPLKLLFGFLF